ncbi:sugar ABC transporter substrate-binding protein [Candidatus Protofrankia californiensis]|uniref:sugar ABC transporter substrate-binding protein n=1 Tax=Candidatus Protofrankia californiensis TaxID=1839754 RepID=UPI0024B58616|nr:substrate-binding domain-containing protein [Candidatus Protofrankia californiensis]
MPTTHRVFNGERTGGARGPVASKRLRLLLVAGVALVTAITACGSSSTPSGSDGPSSSSSSTASSGGSSSEVEKANAFIKPYLTPPTKISITEPLASPPPAGKTLVYLQCEQPQCQVIGVGVQAAAEAAGWQFKSIPFQSTNPSTLTSGLTQALRYNPVAVSVVAAPYALWSGSVPQYQQAGVPIIPVFVGPAESSSTIIANVANPDYAALQGQLLSAWFIADSNAKGKVLSVSIPDYPYLGAVSAGFEAAVPNGCSACEVTKIKVGIPDVGNGSINSTIVSALRKDPSIKYVAVSNSAFVQALPAALGAAGLTGKVKIVGCCGSRAEEEGLKSGQFSAVTGIGSYYAGWLVVDAAIRHAQGLPIPANEGFPSLGLLTKDSQIPPSDSYDQPADYADQFKALWKIR